jgi:hypothetical protein
MTAEPRDGLGDGTATTQTDLSTVVDVTKLTREEAWNYRRELRLALRNPGMEFDEAGPQEKIDGDAYRDQLRRVDDYLTTFDQAS